MNELLGLVESANAPPVPETILQKPVPLVGALAASVAVVRLQLIVSMISGPALAAEG